MASQWSHLLAGHPPVPWTRFPPKKVHAVCRPLLHSTDTAESCVLEKPSIAWRNKNKVKHFPTVLANFNDESNRERPLVVSSCCILALHLCPKTSFREKSKGDHFQILLSPKGDRLVQSNIFKGRTNFSLALPSKVELWMCILIQKENLFDLEHLQQSGCLVFFSHSYRKNKLIDKSIRENITS